MLHVPTREKRNFRVCSAPKWSKETSVMCSIHGVAFCKTPCFGEYLHKRFL
jgi:hypothetical protein